MSAAMGRAPSADEDRVIQYSVTNGIATARMNRPKQRNPFTPEFLDDMAAIVAEVKRDRNVSALILTGSDGVFCAGGDIKSMVERNKKGGAPGEETRERLYGIHEWLQPFRQLEVPVITAVDGVAYGGGFALALCSDFVLASPTARFCSVFCRIGLVPDCGVIYTLPRAIGLQRAKELMYTGRPVPAEEAKALGIVMDIHPSETLEQEAVALAERMAGSSRAAFGMTKRLANQAFENDPMAHVEMEAAAQAICLNSAYHSDAVDRFVAKQPLKFNWEA